MKQACLSQCSEGAEWNCPLSISLSNTHMPFISSHDGQSSPDHFSHWKPYFLLIFRRNTIFIWKSKKGYSLPTPHPHRITLCNTGMWLLQNPQKLLPLPRRWPVPLPASPCGLPCTRVGVPWFLAKTCVMDKPGLDVAVPSTALLNAPWPQENPALPPSTPHMPLEMKSEVTIPTGRQPESRATLLGTRREQYNQQVSCQWPSPAKDHRREKGV